MTRALLAAFLLGGCCRGGGPGPSSLPSPADPSQASSQTVLFIMERITQHARIVLFVGGEGAVLASRAQVVPGGPPEVQWIDIEGEPVRFLCGSFAAWERARVQGETQDWYALPADLANLSRVLELEAWVYRTWVANLAQRDAEMARRVPKVSFTLAIARGGGADAGEVERSVRAAYGEHFGAFLTLREEP
ncbi:MAG: hypothetical protein HY608_11135 [Planctomycetes bacterium]|nr:hypothetical protein [Planctomycetota bacterium]